MKKLSERVTLGASKAMRIGRKLGWDVKKRASGRTDYVTFTKDGKKYGPVDASILTQEFLMRKLKEKLKEKFASKAQQRYLYATNPEAAEKLGDKMTKKDYKELPDKVNEDYSQRARNFRVALRRRLEAMKKGKKIKYGKLAWTALGNGNFKDSRGRTVPGQDIVQDLKRAVQSDIMQHRGARGDDMVDAYLKFEGKLTEAKFYVTYTKGGGRGKAVVTSKESDYEKPRVFKNYNDAAKYVKRAKSGGSMAGQITSYWVSDINMNRIDKRGKVEESDFQLDQAFLDAKPVEERLKKGETGCCHHCGHSHRKGSAHVTPYRTGKNSCANRKSESSMNSNVIIYEEHPHDLPPDDKAIEEYDVVNEQDLREFLTYWKENYLCESCGYTETLEEAEYQGRKVKLGKPMQGDVKKFKVYVKNPKGNVVKVNFGQKGMEIKKDNPERRKSFRARHNCDSPGPRHKARYWSCRKW